MCPPCTLSRQLQGAPLLHDMQVVWSPRLLKGTIYEYEHHPRAHEPGCISCPAFC